MVVFEYQWLIFAVKSYNAEYNLKLPYACTCYALS